jgi:hypothetical protein
LGRWRILAHISEITTSFNIEQFEVLKKWLLRKIVSSFGSPKIRLHRLSAVKKIERKIKGFESSIATISHLISSGPLVFQ